jgi:hypothetical protein
VDELSTVPEERREDDRDQRAVRALALLALIVIVILFLLLLSLGGSNAIAGGFGSKRIVAVPEAATEPGVISVWLDESRSIEAVLSDAGINADQVVDMGGGRYVIGLAVGEERRSVLRLRGTAGVYDAGFVYEER